MKILQIENYFHPEAGYQINILSKYLASFGNEVFIFTSRAEYMPNDMKTFFGIENIEDKDRFFSEKYSVQIKRLNVKRVISRRVLFDNSIFNEIKMISPDILYIHENDSLFAMQYLMRMHCYKYAVIMDSHMLPMASKNKFSKLFHVGYKVFFAPKINRNEITVIRTQDDDYTNTSLGIKKKLTPWISVGSDLTLFGVNEEHRIEMRRKYKISQDARVFIYAGKLDESKGAMLLADAINLKYDDYGKDIVFLIIGNCEGRYGRVLEKKFEASKFRVVREQTQNYINLPPYYQGADVAIFPKQCSLSFYDVQACGLPVIFEDNNINKDRGSHHNAVTFYEDDIQDLARKIQFFISLSNDKLNEYKKNSVNYINDNYNYKTIARRYFHEFEKTINRNKGAN